MMKTNVEIMGKSIDITNKILKPVCQIGNTVLIGGVFGACVAFPPLAIPLKICAGISAAALSDFLTEKTDAHIDKCCEIARKELMPMAEAMDKREG